MPSAEPAPGLAQAIDSADLVESLQNIVRDAGAEILDHYSRNDSSAISHKSDHSPLTEADLAAHELIEKRLSELRPSWPILSEESTNIDLAATKQWQYFWLVDPLDGTREFIKRTDEFTVNIALIQGDRPILGIVYAPVSDQCYWASQGEGAWLSDKGGAAQQIFTRPWSGKELTVIVSRSHPSQKIQHFLKALPWSHTTEPVGSSLKLCVIARGDADIYPRLGHTSLWDIAAAECVVNEAGGKLTDLDGRDFKYRPADGLINPFFVVSADETIPRELYLREARRALEATA